MPYYGKGSNSIKNNQSDFRREFTSAHFGGQFHFLEEAVSWLRYRWSPRKRRPWGSRRLAVDRQDLQRGKHTGSGEAVEFHHRNGIDRCQSDDPELQQSQRADSRSSGYAVLGSKRQQLVLSFAANPDISAKMQLSFTNSKSRSTS
jgi:hypothetical protein